MRLATKIKAFAGVIVLAAAVAMVFNVNSNSIGIRPGSDDNYLLSSKWIPGVMPFQSPVTITVTVDGIPIIPGRTVRLSPWQETMTAEHGAQIKLVVSAMHSNLGLVDCMILRNNRVVPGGGFDSLPGPGVVTCIA